MTVGVVESGIGEVTSGTEAERGVLDESAKFASASRALVGGKYSMGMENEQMRGGRGSNQLAQAIRWSKWHEGSESTRVDS